MASASITLNGSSLSDAPGLASGQTGVYLLSLDGTSITSSSFSFINGADVTSSATYGSSFQVLGTNTVTVFGSTFLSSGHVVEYGSGVDQNDVFGVLVFESSTIVDGETYRIWTDGGWALPADSGGSFTFGSEFSQLSTAASETILIPEPSAALLGGIGALLLLRRRRTKD